MKSKLLNHPKWVNLALSILLALLWSGSFINIKIVVEALPPIFCSMIRVLISLFCLIILFVLMRKNVFSLPKNCWRLWVAGLFAQSFPFAFLFYGEKFIAPALASIINSTVSLWALLLGTLLFRDFSQWTPTKVIGIILGFVGIVIIFSPFLHGSENTLIGIISVMAMAVSYAIGGLINQHVVFKHMQVTFEVNLIQQHFASVLFLLVTSLFVETWPSWSDFLSPRPLLAFLYLGLMATAIAWVIYFYLIREWGAVSASSVIYIVPLLTIIWDAVFLHLMPTETELTGMLIILLGVTCIQWIRKKQPELGGRSKV